MCLVSAALLSTRRGAVGVSATVALMLLGVAVLVLAVVALRERRRD